MDTTPTKEKINIKAEQFRNYERIFMLNGLNLTDKYPLYKYIPYNRFVSSVKNSELIFVSPITWLDPFERRFWKTKYSSYGFTQPDIACMCLTTKAITNEEAAWKMYADGKDKLLRVAFIKETLFNILEDYAITNDCYIYVGKAIYDYTHNEIMHLHDYKNVFFPSGPNSFNIEHYLSLMCLKRKSFAFENEIRIFIVKERIKWDNNMIKVQTPIDDKLIKVMKIGPLAPYAHNDPRKVVYNKIQKEEENIYKKELNSLFPNSNIKILQSQLYADKTPLAQI